MVDHQNIFGRRSGRGLRPWLLIPKYICVCMIVGGLFSAGVVCVSALRLTPVDRGHLWNLMGLLFRCQIVPFTAAALLLGITLLMQHPREFLRMRWLRLKIALVLVTVPLSHLYLRIWLQRMQNDASLEPTALLHGMMYALLLFIVIAIVGRLKPRLAHRAQRHPPVTE